MIQHTLENDFILYLFQTLLAGLILVGSVWKHYYSSERSEGLGSRYVLAFFCLSGSLLFKCLLFFLLSSGILVSRFTVIFLFASLLETASILWLIYSMGGLVRMNRHLFGIILIVIPLAAILFVGTTESIQHPENPYQQALVDCVLTVFLLLTLNQNDKREWVLRAGIALFALSYLFETLHLLQFQLVLWNVQHLAKLLGLLFFVLRFEREPLPILVQFFIRLNLVFIISANIFMLVLSEVERTNYLKFSAENAGDLAEFLRGHAIFYYRLGESPAVILDRDEITSKVVSEFGHIVNLKEVKVVLSTDSLRMSIDQDGLISTELGHNLFPVDTGVTYDYQRNSVTILRMPIVSDGNQLGMVELTGNLLKLGQRISARMRYIFLTFTAIVFVTLLFLGLIVVRAHRIITQQYKDLDEGHQELMQASRLAAVGQLIDGVAHEINNPAGVVLIRSECALAVRGVAESVREDLQEIRSQASRITKIVRNLLTFSRPNPLRMIKFDLNEVVTRSLSLLHSYEQMSGIIPCLDLEPSLPSIIGDPDRIEQVIVNVGKNAIDAMVDGGNLFVCTSTSHDSIQLVVRDTGHGMSSETVKRIFDPLFSTKETSRGTGLGLAISYGIIRDHRGGIAVQSEPGGGTTVTIRLPMDARKP